MKKAASLLLLLLFITSTALAKDKVVKRGAAIAPDAKAVAVADVLKNPDDYTKNPVVVEGKISSVCTMKGCWMELAPGVHVTFKDYGFFVPTDSKGWNARAEGLAEVKTLTKEEADHLEGEGAKLARNADGTAREVSFVASGVELRK